MGDQAAQPRGRRGDFRLRVAPVPVVEAAAGQRAGLAALQHRLNRFIGFGIVAEVRHDAALGQDMAGEAGEIFCFRSPAMHMRGPSSQRAARSMSSTLASPSAIR